MSALTTQQLAELLIGIARAQQAMIEALENQRPGYKFTYLAPVLAAAARVRNTEHVPTLADFPARVLLAHQGRNPPDAAQIVRDLESLLSAQPPALAAAAPAAAPSLDIAPQS
jgi:hypothetical protein